MRTYAYHHRFGRGIKSPPRSCHTKEPSPWPFPLGRRDAQEGAPASRISPPSSCRHFLRHAASGRLPAPALMPTPPRGEMLILADGHACWRQRQVAVERPGVDVFDAEKCHRALTSRRIIMPRRAGAVAFGYLIILLVGEKISRRADYQITGRCSGA